MIKLILFDLGNVVLPFEHRIIGRRLSRMTSFSQHEVNGYIFKAGLARSYEKGELSSARFFGILKKKFNLGISFEVFKPIWEDIFVSNRGVDKILRKLKGKYRLCLLSNTNELHFNYVRRKFKILEVFDRYYLSYKLRMLKPEKGIYMKVLASEKIKPEECVYVDDIEKYVKAAGKLGIAGIQFKSVKQLKSELAGRDIDIN